MAGAASRDDRPLDPVFEVAIDGAPLTARLAGSLRRLTVMDDVDLPGMAELEIAEADPPTSPRPALVDDDRVAPGKAIEIKLGWRGAAHTVFAGEIAAVEPEFDVARAPVLRVRGYDARQRLQRGAKMRTFVGLSDSDVATRIGREAGLTVEASDSKVVHDYLVQANQSDLAFLSERARAIGYEIAFAAGKLLFRPRGFGAGEAVTLSAANDLLRFSASWSLAQQVDRAEVRAWSVKDKAALVGAAAAGEESAAMAGDTGSKWVGRVFSGATMDRVGDHSADSQAEVDALAKARLDDAGLALIRAEGRLLGRADLAAGSVVKVTDAGTRFSGPYYLTAVTHLYSEAAGFLTEFSARRNAV